MKLHQLRRDSKIQRRFLLGSIGAAISVVTVLAVALSAVAMFSYRENADRLAAVSAICSGAAVLLAVVASLVALMAYAVSTGSPDLQFQLHFEFSYPNNPSFKASAENNGTLVADAFKQTTGRVSLRNTSRYSATNPTVIIRLRGMAFLYFDVSGRQGPWEQMAFITTVGITALQWDGGPQYSIHGESTRVLPPLYLDRLKKLPNQDDPGFAIEILAESYRREVFIPAKFVLEDYSPAVDKESPEWL